MERTGKLSTECRNIKLLIRPSLHGCIAAGLPAGPMGASCERHRVSVFNCSVGPKLVWSSEARSWERRRGVRSLGRRELCMG